MTRIVLLSSLGPPWIDHVRGVLEQVAPLSLVSGHDELDRASMQSGRERTVLLSFGTGIIVPSRLLGRFSGGAYNLHPGSPDFPGRDPHHHAVYRGVQAYGATLHVMEERVDAGAILGIEMFPVSACMSPLELLAAANDAGVRLISRMADSLVRSKPPEPLANVGWGPVKTTRADMLRLCSMDKDITVVEMERRIRAFHVPGYNNINLMLHGRRFILADPATTG